MKLQRSNYFDSGSFQLASTHFQMHDAVGRHTCIGHGILGMHGRIVWSIFGLEIRRQANDAGPCRRFGFWHLQKRWHLCGNFQASVALSAASGDAGPASGCHFFRSPFLPSGNDQRENQKSQSHWVKRSHVRTTHAAYRPEPEPRPTTSSCCYQNHLRCRRPIQIPSLRGSEAVTRAGRDAHERPWKSWRWVLPADR
jgi:hypothetical protein